MNAVRSLEETKKIVEVILVKLEAGGSIVSGMEAEARGRWSTST